MSFYGQIHKRGLGTDLLSGETKADLLLEAVRCSASWIPTDSLDQSFDNRNKIQGLV